MNKPVKVIWHHTGGTDANACASTQHHTVETIDEWHKKLWPGFTSKLFGYHVGYHLVIDFTHNTITQCRGFNEEGAHTIGMNTSSIGICMIGNYDKCSGDQIPQRGHELIREAWAMCKKAAPHLKISDNVPHRRYSKKSCFGDSLPDGFVQEILGGTATEKITLQEQVIDLLRQLIALLALQVTGKRLSAREIK